MNTQRDTIVRISAEVDQHEKKIKQLEDALLIERSQYAEKLMQLNHAMGYRAYAEQDDRQFHPDENPNYRFEH